MLKKSALDKKKTHVVVQGFHQQPGIDFQEIFSCQICHPLGLSLPLSLPRMEIALVGYQ